MALLSWLAAAACVGSDAARSPDAPAPTVVSSATSNGATPMFAVAEDGARLLSWVAAADGGSEGVLHLRSDGPRGVITSSLVDPLGGIEPHGEAPPVITSGGAGVVYALYTVGREGEGRFPKSALRFARSEDAGATWSVPVSVNEGEAFGSHNFHSLLAGPDGRVYAAWLSNVRGASAVWLRASRDGGRTWDGARAIHDAPTCPCCRTALALDADGTLYAAWRKIFDGDVRDIAVIASRDGGATWAGPVKPRDDGWVFDGCPHAGPSMRVGADGAVHIAWWTGKGGEAGVWYARSNDHGTTWQAQPIDTAARSAPAHVQLALSSEGTVVVVWDDGKSARPGILLRASTDGGEHFGRLLTLSDGQTAASYPVLAIHGDSLTVAWSQTADSAYRAMMAARPDMKDPTAKMGLPRVGQQEVVARQMALRGLGAPD
jgi:hypothetical protein